MRGETAESVATSLPLIHFIQQVHPFAISKWDWFIYIFALGSTKTLTSKTNQISPTLYITSSFRKASDYD